MKTSISKSLISLAAALLLLGAGAVSAFAESCSNAHDMDAATRSSMERAALQMFDSLVRGDAAAMRQNAIAPLAANSWQCVQSASWGWIRCGR